MEGEKDKVLKILVKGAGILFLSAFLVYIIRFFYRVAISRYLGPSDYGLYSLGMMVMSVGALLAVVGMNNGVVKFVSHYRGKEDSARIKGTIVSSLRISFVVGIFFSVLLILFSKKISADVFHNPAFRPILIIFAIAIPFFAVFKLLSKTFMAFKKPEYSSLSSTIARDLSSLLLVLGVIFFGGSLLQISLTVLIATLIAITVSSILLEKFVFPVVFSKVKAIYEYKELLSFSVPLFFSAIFIEIMGWADTFFLGFFRSEVEVGIYNVALPLAASLGIFLTSFSHMFFPIISELKARNNLEEVGKVYSVIGRWIFALSFPVALLFVFFPGTIIRYLFGESYVSGSVALVIVVIGYFVNVITGPAVEVLKTLGKVKFIFVLNSAVALINVILNIALIPKYGINGAAFSTAVALVLRELVLFFKAKSYIKFKYELIYYLKYTLSALIPMSVIYYVLIIFFKPFSVVTLLIGLTLFGISYSLLVLLFKGIGKEDIMILGAVEKKLRINLGIIRRVIERFS